MITYLNRFKHAGCSNPGLPTFIASTVLPQPRPAFFAFGCKLKFTIFLPKRRGLGWPSPQGGKAKMKRYPRLWTWHLTLRTGTMAETCFLKEEASPPCLLLLEGLLFPSGWGPASSLHVAPDRPDQSRCGRALSLLPSPCFPFISAWAFLTLV